VKRTISFSEHIITKPQGYELGWPSMAAHRARGGFVPPFEFYRIEAVDNGYILTGADVIGIIQRGKNKGRKRYSKQLTKTFVSKTESIQEQNLWEETTGKCSRCLGSGEITVKVSVPEGITLDTCNMCYGSGEFNKIEFLESITKNHSISFHEAQND
jgi:hypothetical protein